MGLRWAESALFIPFHLPLMMLNAAATTMTGGAASWRTSGLFL
jgi:hypothetical protein